MRDRTNKNAPWRQPQEPDTGGLIEAAAEFVQRGRKAQAAVGAVMAASGYSPADLAAAADAVIAGRANMGDHELIQLLSARLAMRSMQMEGLQLLTRAMHNFAFGDDTNCWLCLLEAMLATDAVAEANAALFKLRIAMLIDWRSVHGVHLLASEGLLLGFDA